MKFGDYSPPPSPSLDQQHDALQKGLGRAMQWALNGRLADEPLLAACLRDQRHDRQCEASRADWLWRIIGVVNAMERFRVPILHALHDLSDEPSSIQLCELGQCYASSGDEAFRTRLYEIVERKPFSGIPCLGEKEIVELDGERALAFAIGVRGRGLANREWDWDDESLVERAIKRFGEGPVDQLLNSSTDKAICGFQTAWHQEKKRKAERKKTKKADREQFPSQKERMRAITVNEIISAAESEDAQIGQFRGWGINADPTDLAILLRHLWTAKEPKVIVRLLRVFSNRALPEFDARLIELCRHDDAEVQRWAFHALEKNTHRLIRPFAVAELDKGAFDRYLVSLFINNYEQGDERRILEAMKFPDNECELHWLLMNVIKALEKHPDADCLQLSVITYAMTPCENCRCDSVQLLHRQQVVPDWVNEECRHDSAERCRELVEKINGPTGPG